MTNSSVDELSKLFDAIEVGKNLSVDQSENSDDYGETSTTSVVRPFSDVVSDIKAVMPSESMDSYEELPDSMVLPQPKVTSKVEKKETPKIETPNTETPKKSETRKTIESTKSEPIDLPKETTEPKKNKIELLELNDEDLSAFNKIKESYPQFNLFDGKLAFVEFYRYKIRVLKSLLTSYPVLNIQDMNKEIQGMNFKYQTPGQLPDPKLIGIKMGECQITRGRVTELLMKAQMQFPAWKKSYEWLSSKLWKDHESKGVHKRDGLALEHMADINAYFTELQGFIDSATTLDNFLKSTHDSLSRQVACIVIREKSGLAGEAAAHELSQVFNETSYHSDKSLDSLDTIEKGTVIHKTHKSALVQRDFAGAEIDGFLEDIG